MTKRMFWSVFKPAWEEFFSEDNITSAFAKAGIWPFNPQRVLTQISRPIPEVLKPTVMATPYTCKSMRKVQRLYQINKNPATLQLILKAAVKLSADHEVDEHVKKGLIKSLELEKKKRKRGKKMNLAGNETNGCELYGPVEIGEARAFQKEKEERATQEREEKITKNSEADARKVEEALQKEIRREEREREWAEGRAQKAAAQLIAKEAKEAAKQAKRKPLKQTKAAPKLQLIVKLPVTYMHPQLTLNADVPNVGSSRGRIRRMPARYIQE